MKMAAGRYLGYVSIIGIDPDVMEDFGFEAETGRLLMVPDKDAMVFDKSVAYNFYNPRMNNQQHYYMGMNNETPPPVDVLSAKLTMTSDMQYGETRNRYDDGKRNSGILETIEAGWTTASTNGHR